MQYIITKYHGPTNTKPASVTAKQSGGPRVVREYVGAVDSVESAELRAVNRLRKSLSWADMYQAGHHEGGSVWCFSPLEQARCAGITTVLWANE